MERVLHWLVPLLLLLACHQSHAAPKKGTAVPTCGPAPTRMEVFSPKSTECWLGAAVPASALSYAPLPAQQQLGLRKASASSWEQLQELLETVDGPLHVSLSGSLTAAAPLVITGRTAALRVAGPASIQCTDAGSSVFIISR
jgi:hypothetical protein